MIAPNNTVIPPTPILKWEDDGGAIPTVTNVRQQGSQVNVDSCERVCSALAGGALLLHGLMSRSFGGLVTGLIGGGLLYRGLSGHCAAYQALGISTAGDCSSSGTNWCRTDSLCAKPTVIQPE